MQFKNVPANNKLQSSLTFKYISLHLYSLNLYNLVALYLLTCYVFIFRNINFIIHVVCFVSIHCCKNLRKYSHFKHFFGIQAIGLDSCYIFPFYYIWIFMSPTSFQNVTEKNLRLEADSKIDRVQQVTAISFEICHTEPSKAL